MYDNSIGQFFIYDNRLKMIYHPDYGSRLIRQENNNLSAGYIRDSLKSYIESKRPFGSLTEFIDWNKKFMPLAIELTLLTGQLSLIKMRQAF
ncbi:hypothetical protein [Psychrosphaera algicola]|uniref:Uncharacterized protein n=1 Tax=Psychrosphaera algicola TaxID=3023714 RepID=A0ABT5FI40_9GAMM|nr:hypothetical protein [Psychrosphaera sp. G1-22]MDC2890863.1 hypothetical protein [Psychrosphaera sp. G1-22]